MNEQLKKLFEGTEGFKPEFLTKVQGLVESQIDSVRVSTIKETEERYETERLALIETHLKDTELLKESFTDEMVEKLGTFLDKAVLEWANENAPAIDAKIKVEMAEKFLTGMTTLFSEANIQVIGDNEGVVADLQTRLESETAARTEAETKYQSIKESQNNELRESIISKVCAGLADTQIESIQNLSEGIKLEDAKTFEIRIKRYRDLIENKTPLKDPKDGKDGKDEKDPKDPKKDPKDPKKSDDVNGEVNEAVSRQIQAYLKG